MICEVVAQLIGIVVTAYEEVVLFVEPSAVKHLYVSEINRRVVETGSKAESISLDHFVLSL